MITYCTKILQNKVAFNLPSQLWGCSFHFLFFLFFSFLWRFCHNYFHQQTKQHCTLNVVLKWKWSTWTLECLSNAFSIYLVSFYKFCLKKKVKNMLITFCFRAISEYQSAKITLFESRRFRMGDRVASANSMPSRSANNTNEWFIQFWIITRSNCLSSCSMYSWIWAGFSESGLGMPKS